MKVELQDWKPEEGLETPTAQAEFLLAALEEKDPCFFAQSVAVVERVRGCRKASEIWDAIAVGLGAASKRSAARTARASHGTVRRRARSKTIVATTKRQDNDKRKKKTEKRSAR